MERQTVSFVLFEKLLRTRLLGSHYIRATQIFHNYCEGLSFDVTNVLLHAQSQGDEKVELVLQELERHWETHLKNHHPEIRGGVADNLLGVNPTISMFLHVCQDILGLAATGMKPPQLSTSEETIIIW